MVEEQFQQTQAVVQPVRNKAESVLAEHPELPYIVIFLLGAFLLYQYQNIFGLVLIATSAYMLARPRPIKKPSDDAKIAWDDYAGSGIGSAHMVKPYDETIKPITHLGVTNDSLFYSRHFIAFMIPNKAGRIDVTYLRRFPEPGESRHAGSRHSAVLDTAVSDVFKDLEEMDRMKEGQGIEEAVKKLKTAFGVKKTKELVTLVKE